MLWKAIQDWPMLFLAWFCITKNPIHHSDLNFYDGDNWHVVKPISKIKERQAYQWWWKDINRLDYIQRAAEMSNLISNQETLPWLWKSTDTLNNCEDAIWHMRLRWHGRSPR
jgi:hypothetical protein